MIALFHLCDLYGNWNWKLFWGGGGHLHCAPPLCSYSSILHGVAFIVHDNLLTDSNISFTVFFCTVQVSFQSVDKVNCNVWEANIQYATCGHVALLNELFAVVAAIEFWKRQAFLYNIPVVSKTQWTSIITSPCD